MSHENSDPLLSEGIGELTSLQTLDLSQSAIVTLPEGTMHQTIHYIHPIQLTASKYND